MEVEEKEIHLQMEEQLKKKRDLSELHYLVLFRSSLLIHSQISKLDLKFRIFLIFGDVYRIIQRKLPFLESSLSLDTFPTS